jgi:hypothetical protein
MVILAVAPTASPPVEVMTFGCNVTICKHSDSTTSKFWCPEPWYPKVIPRSPVDKFLQVLLHYNELGACFSQWDYTLCSKNFESIIIGSLKNYSTVKLTRDHFHYSMNQGQVIICILCLYLI